MNPQEISIPEVFSVKPFYKHGDTIILKQKYIDIEELWSCGNFSADIAHSQNICINVFPWLSPKETVQKALRLWKDNGLTELNYYFKNRNRTSAKPVMLKYAAIYIQLSHWVNKEPVSALKNVSFTLSQFDYSPLNITERIEFILTSPDHYQAYKTLSQLYIESEKKWAVYMM